MRLLLDTHAFIWWDREVSRLPERVREACEEESASLYLSIASIWEMQIKLNTGKLKFERTLRQVIDDQVANGLEILSVRLAHLWELPNLPAVHNDPFDRMMIAQAKHEDMLLVSADKMFAGYPVKLFW